MTQKTELSIVVPAFRTAGFIDRSVNNKLKVLEKMNVSYEMLVVLDGPDSKAFEKLSKISNPFLKVYQLKKNTGKGYAVRYGLAKSSGNFAGYIDADDDIDPEVISDMYKMILEKKVDIIVGSKNHPESNIKYPFFRKLYSGFFNMLIHTLFRLKVSDTQTVAKLYSKKFVREIVPKCQINRFAFEIEMLALAIKKGYKIQEVPVKVNYLSKSSISFSDGLQVFADIYKIFLLLMNE